MTTPQTSNSLITVLMPVFNGMPYLPEAMDCILSQTEKRITVLALNDGSDDGSLEYLQTISDKRLEIVSQGRNGLVKTLNIGLHLVKTPYIARMDADDLCAKDRFEKQFKFLKENPDCVCVGTSAWHLSTKGDKYGWPVHMPQDHFSIVRSLTERRSAIIHPTFMAKTSILKKINGYREEAYPAEDYDLFFRLSNEGQLANIPDLMYKIRLHSNSVTAAGIHKNQMQYEKMRETYFKKDNRKSFQYHQKIFNYFDSYAVYFYRKGITAHLNGNKIFGFYYLFISILFSPSRALLYGKRKIYK